MTQADEMVSFWEHVDELRKTVIRILLIITIGMLCSFVFYQQVFELLTYPFKEIQRTAEVDFDQPQQKENLIILSPSEGLMTALKTSFWVGLVATSPLWLFFLLQFIAPALRSNERKMIFPFIFFSLLFLSFGVLFSYFLTIPIANKYLNAFNEGLGVNLWTLSNYLDYTVTLMLANALAFELFVVLLFLVHYKWISADGMIAKRKVVLVSIFILSAILTPPDILTQFMLAFPLIGLYELTILYAKATTDERKVNRR
ncbi:MAG: Sec-independent protein translocase protein TatC [Chlamydiae bacterium]|nr:Sec-independent protein translocase protein TatC [Chlamydiota bacterium]